MLYADFEPYPDRLLTFIETEVFRNAWRKCLLNDDDLSELQRSILSQPDAGAVVQATGGVRKLRFSPVRKKRGKSGGYRLLYCYFEEFGVILLITVYSKTRKEDITADEKKAIRKMILEQQKFFEEEADDE